MDRPCINCHQYFDIREHSGKCPYCLTDNFKTNKTNNMKNFKDNQKVNHPKYGEGIINLHHLINKYSINFGDIQTLWKEIGDDFYNQLEAVEDLPNIGDYAYLWNAPYKYCVYAKYQGLCDDNIFKYKTEEIGAYSKISKTPPKFD